MIKKRKVDSTIESRILTGMILSKSFLRDVIPNLNLHYFQSPDTKIIAGWCMEFYENYEDSPGSHIQDIYNREKDRLEGEEDASMIELILKNISKRYEQDVTLNLEYLLDQTLSYFKKRELEITHSNIGYLLEHNRVDDAEHQLALYNKMNKIKYEWDNPFSAKSVQETFASRDDIFFRFPGALGRFMGNMERNWLIAISGGFKVGKTWFMQEFGVAGLIQRKKVAMFSLEMPRKKMAERIQKRIVGDADIAGDHKYPCFDCRRNQMQTCDHPDRINRVRLINDEGERPEYDPRNPYKICTICRNSDNRHLQDNYFPEIWFETIHKDEFEETSVKKRMKVFDEYYGHLFRIKSYPRFSANLSDINRDLDILDSKENFQPDIIIVDYADILKPEREGLQGVQKEDETWMSLSRLGGERHALVVTGTQVKGSALDKKQVKQTDTALWIGKLAHVEGMYTLNQTEWEKNHDIIRVGTMAHRYKEFSQSSSCYVLQKLGFGQFNLDSEIKRVEF